MSSITADCMNICGIVEVEEEVSDSIVETASNVNFAKEDLARLVDALVAAHSAPADVPSGSKAVISSTATEVPCDGKQHQPGKASSIVTAGASNAAKIYDDDMWQKLTEDSTAVLPTNIVNNDGDMQQNPVEASQSTNVSVEKGIDSYVQIIATTILESRQQQLLVSEIYESIRKNWFKFSLNKCTWKNSVRHALSSNSFFTRNGRGPTGRANYWSVHPACTQMFKNGDFHIRRAKSRVQIMEREEKKRQGLKTISYLATTNRMSDGKPDDNNGTTMQRHQSSVNIASSNITESNDSPNSSMSCNALSNQHQQQHHHYGYQQRSQYQEQAQCQQQKPLQHIQNPQYFQQIQQQTLQQQMFQHHQRQQQFQHQEQHQYPQQEHHMLQYQHRQPSHEHYHQQNQLMQPCWFDQSQSRSSGLQFINNPAPSQSTSNTAYYDTVQQHQQYYQPY